HLRADRGRRAPRRRRRGRVDRPTRDAVAPPVTRRCQSGGRMSEPLDFDPYSDVFFNDPYDVYRRLRDEAPAYRNDHYGFWALSRYDDVVAAHRDWRTFTSTQGITIDMLTQPGTSELLKAATG